MAALRGQPHDMAMAGIGIAELAAERSHHFLEQQGVASSAGNAPASVALGGALRTGSSAASLQV